MPPDRSAIVFTTAWGVGCGLLALLGVFASGETVPSDRWFGVAALGIALGALALGLVVWSLHPDRGFARWRSSRTSRAGALAAATCAPAGLFALGWVGYAEVDGIWRVAGLAAAVLAGFTVHTTATIYAMRAQVPAWCNRWTVPLQLALALFAGALWLNALLTLFGRASADAALIVVLTLFLSFYLKRRYWRFIDAVGAASATRHRMPRARAVKLRRYVFVLLFALPLVLAMAAMEGVPWVAAAAATAAALSGSAGAVIERWLFFAEAA